MNLEPFASTPPASGACLLGWDLLAPGATLPPPHGGCSPHADPPRGSSAVHRVGDRPTPIEALLAHFQCTGKLLTAAALARECGVSIEAASRQIDDVLRQSRVRGDG